MKIIKRKPSGLLRLLFRLPILPYRMNFGFLLGNRFLILTHIGRKSGLPRQAVIEVVDHDEETGVYYIAAAWREKSDWFLNILKNPRVKVQVGNRRFEANADLISKGEAVKALCRYAQKHPIALRELTLLILGERLPPSRATCERLAESVPVIALKPVK
jgi:deazaflavin-dependent oxidoreductase (nitroreductase family)